MARAPFLYFLYLSLSSMSSDTWKAAVDLVNYQQWWQLCTRLLVCSKKDLGGKLLPYYHSAEEISLLTFWFLCLYPSDLITLSSAQECKAPFVDVNYNEATVKKQKKCLTKVMSRHQTGPFVTHLNSEWKGVCLYKILLVLFFKTGFSF